MARTLGGFLTSIKTLGGLLAGIGLLAVAGGSVLAGQSVERPKPVTITGRLLDAAETAPDGSIRFHVVVVEDRGPAGPAAGAEAIAGPMFEDSFDVGRKPPWQDTVGTTGAADGKLTAASDRNEVVVAGLEAEDVRVSVDAEAATQMGILVRYRDAKNFVLAFYTPGAKILGFHEMVEGNLGPWIAPVGTGTLTGKAVRMSVTVLGRRVSVELSDGRSHVVRTRAVLNRITGPGLVGLYHDRSLPGTQRFDNFRAQRLDRRLPADAIEVLLPVSEGGPSDLWPIGDRLRITGTEERSKQARGLERVLKVAGLGNVAAIVQGPAERTLFPVLAPARRWLRFPAEGFVGGPACGVVYRSADVVTNGMPLGGIDTGCLDLETSGMLGYATIFNTHVPRRGPINAPILGLSVGGRTWVLCDPQPKDGWGGNQPSASGRKYSLWRKGKYEQTTDLLTPVPMDLPLDGVRTVKEIHYWGHYPVADLEFETGAPVGVGLRAWAPFLPGDVVASMLPGIVFEVHLRNRGEAAQSGTLAFSFPGPLPMEAGTKQFARRKIAGRFHGVEVAGPLASYALGAIGVERARFGGDLAADGAAWAKIHQRLPDTGPGQAGTAMAVDFALPAGQTQVVRFVLAWHAPDWNAGGYNAAGAPHTFTHMYARHYAGAAQAAELLAEHHQSLLRRILAWQGVIYDDPKLPVWLRESLVNVLHLIAETGMWAQARPPLPGWVRPADGLFGMNECPRGCPQIECIPCSFYGNQPLVYFFPQLALSTLRGYKGYQYPDGAAVWVFGGVTGQTPPVDFANPTKGYQFATNGISLAAMVDRYWLCHGRNQKDFAREFLPIVKQNMVYTVNLRPAYGLGDRIIAMPTGNEGTEWFEAPEPGWRGMTAHVGALHLAQLRIAARLAAEAGDDGFARQCDQWFQAGSQSMDKLWTGRYWLNYLEPETKSRSDLIFAYQLDGQWITDHHGLPGALPADRVKTTLATIKRTSVAVTKYGAVNYVNPDGTPAKVAGYGTYSYFPPEALMLAMNYMYTGEKDFGLELARKVWHNIVCLQGYTWDMPNIMRGDVDTGERTYGNDYYQDLMLWSLPAAVEGKDFAAPTRPGGLVDRILRAAAGRAP